MRNGFAHVGKNFANYVECGTKQTDSDQIFRPKKLGYYSKDNQGTLTHTFCNMNKADYKRNAASDGEIKNILKKPQHIVKKAQDVTDQKV
jgi:hypothetical protein